MVWKLLLLLITLAYTRVFQTTFKFTQFQKDEGWYFIDKMTFAPGTATIVFETATTGLPFGSNSHIYLQAISDDRWEIQKSEKCKNEIKFPLAVHELQLDGSTTTSTFQFGIEEYTTYYFVLKDCQHRFKSQYNNPNLNITLNLHLLNNEREIGEEEDHWYIVPFIVGAGLLLVHEYSKDFNNFFRNDWAKLLLFAGTVTQISSLCWKSFGFLIYNYSGSDYYFFHLIYLMLHSTSESAIIALVVLISFGWTLTYNSGNQLDLYLPLIGCLGFLNIVVTMITKVGHSHDRHHVFDNVGGTILVGFRCIIILIFIWGCIRTYRRVRHNLKKFMLRFSILGFVYIASMPTIVGLANYLIPAKDRHEFVFIAVQMIKFATNLTLAYEMNSQNSTYNKVNYKNSSFIPENEVGF